VDYRFRLCSTICEPPARCWKETNASLRDNTNWHIHPDGQILLITEGTGYYPGKKASGSKSFIKGDVLKCAPDVAHWHGAAAESTFACAAVAYAKRRDQMASKTN
jgi:quercetin dioxygenase-like cupin family protein